MADRPDLPKPTCLALILCEQVIQDGRTKNLTLVNTFNTVGAPFVGKRLPRHSRLAVFASLTGGRGKTQGKLTIEDPNGTEIFHGEGPVVFPDPVSVVEITFDIRALPLPCEGDYVIRFWCDDVLRQRTFRVKDADKEEK